MHQNIQKLQRQLNDGTLTEQDLNNFRLWGKGFSFKSLPDIEKTKFAVLISQAEDKAKSDELAKPVTVSRPALPRGGHRGDNRPPVASQTAGSNANATAPSVIGEPFHNPYTFIPFPNKPPERFAPTPRNADDDKNAVRFTGVLRLKLITKSPLITSEADAYQGKKDEHQKFHALTIGNDVVLPASGVRGALRTLMTTITGGTLGYMDENLWLCQGRDAQLGPKGKTSLNSVPDNVFLAKVIRPGNATHDGVVQLGITDLEKAEVLGRIDDKRPSNGKYNCQDLRHSGKEVRLSGRPVNRSGKREGLFSPTGPEITLPAELWRAYQGRNRHGDFPELKKGWLIWLEPATPGTTQINSAADVKSIQWARWGRRGQSLEEALKRYHEGIIPDSMNPDGKVDLVTGLFGQVPLKEGAAAAFAGRIRPANLVFEGGKAKLETNITLAPLMPPHPGCVAFYRKNSNIDQISQDGKLRGYKVYRTTEERGLDAPYCYAQQPVFNKTKPSQPAQQKINKTVDLLNEGVTGSLELSLYSLTFDELSLLLHTCSVEWRLGGGKPFGLGHCHIDSLKLIDEFGDTMDVESHKTPLPEEIQKRLDLYKKTQIPVKRLRYPRAVKPAKNPQSAVKAGHAWFSRHAAPKKSSHDSYAPMGLETIWTDGELKQKTGNKDQIKAQPLPPVEQAPNDVLYGYDCNADEVVTRNKKTLVAKLSPSIPGSSTREGGGDGRNYSQNRGTRQGQRQQRR